MRYMPMTVIGPVPVVHPFLQVSPAPHLHRSQLFTERQQAVGVLLISVQNLSCCNQVRKNIVDYLIVHGGTGHYANTRTMGVFGGHGGTKHHPAVYRFFLQYVFKKQGSSHQYGIILFEKSPVARIEIMLPDMLAEPGTSHRPETVKSPVHRSAYTPAVGIVVYAPTSGTVHLTGGLSSGNGKIAEHGKQRLVHFR